MAPRFDSQKHHRRSIRLKNYDYTSEGAYYVTIVTQGRVCLFGEIIDGAMHLNEHGKIAQKWWEAIPVHFPNATTGAFIVMPNHVHGIIFITNERRGEVISPRTKPNQDNIFTEDNPTKSQGGETPPLRRRALGQIIAYFKYQSTKEINFAINAGIITKIWQRNYYEHIIRNELELKQKTDYILDNPSRWEEDQEHPENKKAPG